MDIAGYSGRLRNHTNVCKNIPLVITTEYITRRPWINGEASLKSLPRKGLTAWSMYKAILQYQLLRRVLFWGQLARRHGKGSNLCLWSGVWSNIMSCGWCISWQKCWWSWFQLVDFGSCPFMIRYCWSFNMGSSRMDNPSLLKRFWHSSSSHVLILWFPGGGMETYFLGVIWGQTFFPYAYFDCLGLKLREGVVQGGTGFLEEGQCW